MKDPFPFEPVPWLSKAVRPFSDFFGLPTLPLHIHEVAAAALVYSVIYWPISPLLSHTLASKYYSKMSRNRQINWDAHVVSMIQSVIINTLALWVILFDNERGGMNRQERIWGYTPGPAFIQALGAGYFVWDLFVTGLHVDVFGLGTLAHAIAALVVYGLGFRPFVNYYSCNFILWELSTPFLNIHWFMDKVNMTGSKAQLYNGIALLATFFSARLVYGTLQAFRVFSDIWYTIGTHPDLASLSSPLMAYVTPASTVPVWLGVMYLASNTTLNFLNFYWFFKMVTAVRKRFSPPAEKIVEPSVQLPAMATGPESPAELRQRKAN